MMSWETVLGSDRPFFYLEVGDICEASTGFQSVQYRLPAQAGTAAPDWREPQHLSADGRPSPLNAGGEAFSLGKPPVL